MTLTVAARIGPCAHIKEPAVKLQDQNRDAPVMETVGSGADRRQHKRYQVDYFLRVVERSTKIVLGQVLDVSARGMMISCARPIKPYRVIDCTLEASLESGTNISLPTQCLTVWCRPDAFGTAFTAGFKFVFVPKTELEALIDTLS